MALENSLPDRPLRPEEVVALQQHDAFDFVGAMEEEGPIDHLFLKRGDSEYFLHYTEDAGWHGHHHGHSH
ncbi:hypothetical protein [Halovivax cerinus]|uniref:DUF7964 domain-containing protein n=1 Tax=Halovivax cerinus TaxID=1487865 RepID=A0ABD5NPF6_9EURY|nr:hypothetical protein [Halovivax cerinus]